MPDNGRSFSPLAISRSTAQKRFQSLKYGVTTVRCLREQPQAARVRLGAKTAPRNRGMGWRCLTNSRQSLLQQSLATRWINVTRSRKSPRGTARAGQLGRPFPLRVCYMHAATIFYRSSLNAYRYREMVRSDQGLRLHPTLRAAARTSSFISQRWNALASAVSMRGRPSNSNSPLIGARHQRKI